MHLIPKVTLSNIQGERSHINCTIVFEDFMSYQIYDIFRNLMVRDLEVIIKTWLSFYKMSLVS